MIVSDISQYDLTGKNTDYTREDRRFKVFARNQKIDLAEAAYSNSIKVYLVNGTSRTLIPRSTSAAGWDTYPLESCQDLDAMSTAKVRFDSIEDVSEKIAIYTSIGHTPVYVYAWKSDAGVIVYTETEAVTTDTKVYTTPDLSGEGSKPSAAVSKVSLTLGGIVYNRSETDDTYQTMVWDATLVNCFYMQNTVAPTTEYEIAVTYQGFKRPVASIDRDGLGPEYSPGLMRSVIEKVDELYAVRNPVTMAEADCFSGLQCMPEDLTGVASTNKVENEIHYVDVASNKFVIRPQNGSFYKTGVALDYVVGNTVERLVEGADYTITGLNREKTAVSEPSCGVYEFIVLKRASLAGKILLGYQAFGGEVSQTDINALKEIVFNMYRVVNAANIVTTDNLPYIQYISTMVDRIDYLEETLRHYQAQRFRYTTKTSDKWVNIAFIQKQSWSQSADIETSDVGEFKIEVPEYGLKLDLMLNYDMKSATNQFNLTAYHIEAPCFADYGFSYFQKRVLPKFRIIYIGYDESEYTTEKRLAGEISLNKGLMLQMTLDGPVEGDLEGIVRVTDRYGTKSPWTLIDSLGEERPTGTDTNDQVTFPNGVVWKAASHKQTNIVSVYPQGYTVFIGSIPVTELEAASVTHTDQETGDIPTVSAVGFAFTPEIDGTAIILDEVTAIEFRVFDRFTGRYLLGRSQDITVSVKDNVKTISADAMYFTDDMCVLSLKMTEQSGVYTGTLFSRTGTNSLLNDRFDLVQIDLIR